MYCIFPYAALANCVWAATAAYGLWVGNMLVREYKSTPRLDAYELFDPISGEYDRGPD